MSVRGMIVRGTVLHDTHFAAIPLLSFFSRSQNDSPSLSSALQKAVVNAPQSKRFAQIEDAGQSRSVWTACVFSTPSLTDSVPLSNPAVRFSRETCPSEE